MMGTIWLIETGSPMTYSRMPIHDGDALVFGSESKGLPPSIREQFVATTASIPMLTDHVRSLNLANAVAIVLYDGLRRLEGW